MVRSPPPPPPKKNLPIKIYSTDLHIIIIIDRCLLYYVLYIIIFQIHLFFVFRCPSSSRCQTPPQVSKTKNATHYSLTYSLRRNPVRNKNKNTIILHVLAHIPTALVVCVIKFQAIVWKVHQAKMVRQRCAHVYSAELHHFGHGKTEHTAGQQRENVFGHGQLRFHRGVCARDVCQSKIALFSDYNLSADLIRLRPL